MEFYDDYISRLDTEDTDPDLLDQLLQEAAQSLQRDPPERALTLAGQMAAALLLVAKRQEPPEQDMVNTINELTAMMIDYLDHLGWHQRAVKTKAGWVYEQMPSSS